MLALSINSLIEEANLADPGQKRLAGNIGNIESMLEPEHLVKLEQRLGDVAFAFLAFDPRADAAVRQYVEEGTLASDAGPHVLALFTLAHDAASPVELDDEAFVGWLELDLVEQPAYQLIRLLFEPGPVPPLPGIAFFARLSEPCEVVYFDLGSLDDAAKVRTRLRALFALVDDAVRSSKGMEKVANTLAVAAERGQFQPFRSGRVSIRQWLTRGARFVGDHAGDIVAVLGLVV
jgi:hypothetical protein